MNLKKRLMAANLSIVILPAIITVIVGFLFLFLFNSMSGTRTGYENFEKVTLIRYELYTAAERIWKDKPETLAKPEFAQYISARLEGINAKVLVLKKREPVYADMTVNNIDLEKILAKDTSVLQYRSIKVGDVKYLTNSYSFTIEDNIACHFIILTPISQGTEAAGAFLLFLAVVFMLSFVATTIYHSINLSRSIANPLARLKIAVGEISKGNLDYKVIETGDEEIREVMKALELMRLQLEESVTTQMKYDDNRKMLVSSISHDLKTPITSIKGYVEGILDGVAQTPEKKEKYLKTIYAKAVQIDRMIDDLLLYSKLDLKQIPYNFEKTDIVKYFEDCVIESESEITKSGISIIFENRLLESFYVQIDRERMKRVVLNLFDNAQKYMDKQDGFIRVIIRETIESVIIEIQDNGAGIPNSSLSQIFDRFYRSDFARSSKEGSGLGLAIAKQIVEGHEGQIWVISEEGIGTRFMISLKKVI